MELRQNITLATLLVLLFVSLASVILTRSWADYRKRLRAERLASRQTSLVDTHPLDTAQQLAPLAVTHSEQQDAQDALRFGDRAVDLAFAAALQDAAENPPPLTPETKKLAARIKSLEDATAADEERITQLNEQVAKAPENKREALQDQLDLEQAQQALDQDDLDDAHQDFIRAGGDKQATIQSLMAKYQASESQVENGHANTAPNPSAPTVTSAAHDSGLELTKSKSIVAQVRAALSLNSKEDLLMQAKEDAAAAAASLDAEHDALEKKLDDEKSQKSAGPAAASAPKSGSTPPGKSPSQSAAPSASASARSELSVLEEMQRDQKKLSQFDKRVTAEQQLAATYQHWIETVDGRKKMFLHGVLSDIFWILFIVLLAFLANQWIRGIFARLALERRDLHAMGTVLLLALQAVGLVLVLLVIFSTPNNFGTVIALAGAGFTVALNDFILGFIGWFFLIGRDGIRPGDWVEINGVSGEVIELGPIHTVLLETGKWEDAAHPTGRRVSLINSYAIKGQYFNFSASGQWLWDEIALQVGQDADPFRIAEAVKKIAAEATSPNARDAEQAWDRVVPQFAQQKFSAEPSISITTSGSGITILVRYITRVRDRQEVRSKIYREIVELLRSKNLPDTAAVSTPESGPSSAPPSSANALPSLPLPPGSSNPQSPKPVAPPVSVLPPPPSPAPKDKSK
jgi:small-conductance mechanosensitive channel